MAMACPVTCHVSVMMQVCVTWESRHQHTKVEDAHAVAEGLLGQVVLCMFHDAVYDGAGRQWQIRDL